MFRYVILTLLAVFILGLTFWFITRKIDPSVTTVPSVPGETAADRARREADRDDARGIADEAKAKAAARAARIATIEDAAESQRIESIEEEAAAKAEAHALRMEALKTEKDRLASEAAAKRAAANTPLKGYAVEREPAAAHGISREEFLAGLAALRQPATAPTSVPCHVASASLCSCWNCQHGRPHGEAQVCCPPPVAACAPVEEECGCEETTTVCEDNSTAEVNLLNNLSVNVRGGDRSTHRSSPKVTKGKRKCAPKMHQGRSGGSRGNGYSHGRGSRGRGGRSHGHRGRPGFGHRNMV